MDFDPNHIKKSLERLKESSPAMFGAEDHHFSLNAPLTEAQVHVFEERNALRLPADYREFLTRIGNGGAGPGYGIFPLGNVDSNFDIGPWQRAGGIVGDLSEPFPFEAAWNDLTGMPSGELTERNREEYELRSEDFEKHYWSSSLVNGAIPISHEGCAIRLFLIVTGEQAGFLWRDGRSEYTGLSPVLLRDGSRATFSRWYKEWLETALQTNEMIANSRQSQLTTYD